MKVSEYVVYTQNIAKVKNQRKITIRGLTVGDDLVIFDDSM